MKQVTNYTGSGKPLTSLTLPFVLLNKQKILNAIILMSVISVSGLSGGIITAEDAFAQFFPNPLPEIDSANTIINTLVTVTFSEPVYNQGGTTSTDYGACFTVGGASVTATSLPTSPTGTNITIFLTVSTPFGVNDTPIISYDTDNCTDGNIAAFQGASLLSTNITPTDGIVPSAPMIPVDSDSKNPISIDEDLAGTPIRVSLGTSGALSGDIIELLRNGMTFDAFTPLAFTLTLDDITNGYYDFVIPTDQLGPGDNFITAIVTDVAGNISAQSPTLTLFFDVFPPTHGIIFPASNAFENAGLAVSWTNSEVLSSGFITFTNTGGTTDSTAHVYPLSSSHFDSGPQGALQATLEANAGFNPLVDGAIYSIAVTTTDLAGNSATTTNTSITYDVTPPTITNVTPLTGATITAPFDVKFTNSEVLTSGIIIFERTDTIVISSGIHHYNLSGTDLNSGAITISQATLESSSTFAALYTGGVYTMTINTVDLAGNTSDTNTQTSITFELVAPNSPPVLGSIGNKSVNEEVTLTFTATATDSSLPDGTLTYTIDSAAIALGASINPTSGVFTWTPTEAQGGSSYDITVTVTDDGTGTLSDSETITVTVNEVNTSPVLGSIGDKSVNELVELTFTATATDSDLPANPLRFILFNNFAVGSIINPTSGEFTWTPTESQGGSSYTVVVQVDDDTSVHTELITITVNEVNNPPTSVGNTITTLEDNSYTFSPSDFPFTDVDGDSFVKINIHFLSGNGELTFDGAPILSPYSIVIPSDDISNLVYTPALNDNGVNSASFNYYVNDGTEYSASSATLSIDITPVNDAPTSENKTITIDEDTPYTFSSSDFAFNDVDVGDALISVKIETLPLTGELTIDGVSISAGENIPVELLGSLTYVPEGHATSPPNVTFTFTVNDGGLDSEISNTITITIDPVNDAPTSADFTVTTDEDGSYTFLESDFPFSDIDDGDALVSVRIFSLPASGSLSVGLVSLNIEDIEDLVFTPAADESGSPYTTFQFRGSDGVFETPVHTITINVTPVNDAPRFNDFSSPSATEHVEIKFTIDATDPEGDPITYSIFSTSAYDSSSYSINPDTGEITWTPSERDGDQSIYFEVLADDGTDTSTRTARVIVGDIPVEETNSHPVLDSIGDQSVTVLVPLTFTVTATDSDIPEQGLQFFAASGTFDELSSLPSGAEMTEDGVFTWTPVTSQSGTYDIFVIVFDEIVDVDSDVAFDVSSDGFSYDYEEFIITVISESSGDDGSDKNGGGCSDCEAPTLGLDSNYKRIVENGFTYNGKSVDAERFFTPYPLITANIGETNTAVFKIYENGGIDNIKHFSFAFGLASDDVISNSKAMIELDIDYDGTETVTVTDPKNALDNISVTTDVVECAAGSTAQCLEVTIDHRFRAPLEFNIVATDVWDQKRNAWQNYFNHGIEIVGESMNPPEEYNGINAGQIYHLTETSKTTATDEFDNTWSLEYGNWAMDYFPAPRPQDAPTEVMTRMHSEFAGYKESQIRNAIEQLLVLCPTCLDSAYTDFDDSWSYDIPNVLEKLSDPEIQQRMILENQKAQEIMDYLLDPSLYR